MRRKFKGFRASMKTKLAMGLGSIAIMLLVSSIISILEYRRMSNYVTDLISADIKCINLSQKIGTVTEQYNLMILDAIGEESWAGLPGFDQEALTLLCDSLKSSLPTAATIALADSLEMSYKAYLEASTQVPGVIVSDFIDSRDWYFEQLQPCYNRLKTSVDSFTDAMYVQLQTNSETFQESFYRSIVPGIVAVGAGLVLVLLLMFFINVYYADPVYKMLAAIRNSSLTGARYKCAFDGNDEMAHLNESLTDIMDENVELRRRVKDLRDEREKLIEAVQSVQE